MDADICLFISEAFSRILDLKMKNKIVCCTVS